MADKRSKSSVAGPPPAVAQAVATIEAVNVYPDVVQGVPYQPPGGAYQPPIPPNHYGDVRSSFRAGEAPASFDEGACRRYLFEHGWPLGLQSALIGSVQKVPIRYVICDDSGSMMTTDGNKVVGTGNASRLVSCSRWAELTEVR